ncbi:hypothetical protein [Alkalihalophilus marmarensis]|nr:hypothetical protein [Alkalihalophilus marmarensis]MEC2071262.1 hypothetical protein [Alkalihalophilus marmarensis]
MLDKNVTYIGYKLKEDIHSPSQGLLLKKGAILTKEEVERLTQFLTI